SLRAPRIRSPGRVRRRPSVRRRVCDGIRCRPGPGPSTGSATCPASAPRRPCPCLPEELLPCSAWARGTSPAQGLALGAPDEIYEGRPGLEGERAAGGDGQHGGRARREVEPVGGAAAGEGVEAEVRELRPQAQRAL